jgi:hypothetical protein
MHDLCVRAYTLPVSTIMKAICNRCPLSSENRDGDRMPRFGGRAPQSSSPTTTMLSSAAQNQMLPLRGLTPLGFPSAQGGTLPIALGSNALPALDLGSPEAVRQNAALARDQLNNLLILARRALSAMCVYAPPISDSVMLTMQLSEDAYARSTDPAQTSGAFTTFIVPLRSLTGVQRIFRVCLRTFTPCWSFFVRRASARFPSCPFQSRMHRR